MKKRALWIVTAVLATSLCILLLLPSSAPQPGGTYENLIRNGTFDALDESGMPENWYAEAYVFQGYTEYSMEDGKDGPGAHIKNLYPNDARFAQAVSVSPNTTYHLHGFIRADAEGGLGANLSIEGIYVFSDCLFQTDGEWQEVSLYGVTGPKQTGVTVYARLGGYSGEATGEAWFDDITLCRVDEVPSDHVLTRWYQESPAAQETESVRPVTGETTLLLISLVYAALFFLLCRALWQKEEPLEVQKGWNREKTALILILLLGLIARLLTAKWVPGYDVDIGCFRAWATQMSRVGPGAFYSQGFCDYSPGYLWVLWGIGLIGQALGGVSEFLVKTPSILCDLILCVLFYTEGRKYGNGKRALLLCALYALNPLTFVSGAAWGQVDSVMALLLMLCVLEALRGRWAAALPCYIAAVLAKPQALMFGPLGLAAFVCWLIRNLKTEKKRTLREAGLGLLFSALLFFALVFPFKGSQPVGWLIELYKGTMGEYSYATVNACNLYYLFGENWAGTDGVSPGIVISLCAWLLCVLPCLLALLPDALRIGKAKEKFSLSSLSGKQKIYILGTLLLCLLFAAVPGMLRLLGRYDYSVLQTGAVVFVVAVSIFYFAVEGDIKNLPGLGAAMLLMLFACGPMMHERYLFPAAGLLLMAAIVKKRKEFLLLALLVTLAGFLNVGCALDRNIRIGGADGHLNAPLYGIESDMTALEVLSGLLNCLGAVASMALALLFTRSDLNLTEEKAPVAPTVSAEEKSAPLPQYRGIPKMTRRDTALMLLVTALYAILAFVNLGSLKAPQTLFSSISPEEEVVWDLGEEKTFQAYYFGGIHQYDRDFSIEVSPDGERWEQYTTAAMNIGDCFKWQAVGTNQYPVRFTGRYVRLSADSVGLNLFEFMMRDAITQQPLSAILVSDSAENETAAFLTDENDTMEGDPGWFNSAYFDEIYHARTAYEHLHGMPPYETTHPPLGKVLMSFAIAVFGMTPFGWRFAGALAGVLMLPGMYLLGKLLIRKKWGGFLSMMLLALDLMHFTQTRIATIDSFVVLFILYAVYFMLRWFFTDPFEEKFLRTLLPLGLSGLFMGLSVASKWTGCYNGVGLGILFFFGIFRHFREIRAAKDVLPQKRTAREALAAEGEKNQLLTVASCLVFFIAVPLLIYYLSYIPYFAYNGGVTVKKVIEAAVGPYFTTGQVGGMLGYHSTPGLGMDHPFYSPWYEWPLILQPMWYSSSDHMNSVTAQTIVAMGNPVVWWVGLAALLLVGVMFLKKHVRRGPALALYGPEDEPRYAILLICFLAQFLPWMPVPRGTYIYHYFPCVPFIILCIGLCLDKLNDRHEKHSRLIGLALLLLALASFIFFFPYASGITASIQWLDAAKALFPGPIYY